MKKLLMTCAILICATTASAKDISDIKVGDVVCYDGFGPFDVIGTVTSKNYGQDTVMLRRASGGSKSYAAQKIKSPMYCKLKNEVGKELLKRGLDALGESSEK